MIYAKLNCLIGLVWFLCLIFLSLSLYIYIYITLDMTLNNLMVLFTNPSARAGYDTRSIFKRSLTGFEFRVFLLLD